MTGLESRFHAGFSKTGPDSTHGSAKSTRILNHKSRLHVGFRLSVESTPNHVVGRDMVCTVQARRRDGIVQVRTMQARGRDGIVGVEGCGPWASTGIWLVGSNC